MIMIMATAWRSTLRFPEPRPLHHDHVHRHQHRCYYNYGLLWLTTLVFFVIIMEVAGVVEARVSSKGCLQRERDALLLYKAAIEDPSGRLSSWRAQEDEDCCAWAGVVCYNTTGGSVRVAELNLQNHLIDDQTNLRGELLHPSLLSLSHLQSLNLSFNDFEGTQIPPLVGSLHKLRYLDLVWSNFSGTIPPHLGNLTHLRYLDLSYNYAKVVHSLDWLSSLSSLIYLDMSYLNLSAVSHHWISAVNMLPSLQHLYLYDCRINYIPLSLSFHLNLTSLVALDLGGNNFNYSSFPNWFWNLTSLSSLQLRRSEISGTLPTEIGNLNNLTHLDLYSNSLSGPLPDTLWKLKHLTYLDLSDSFLGNALPMGIMNLSSLSTLRLINCSLIGPIPSELGNLTTLNALFLQYNLLSGLIPHEIGNLVNLQALVLSRNSFEGDITEFHLSNLIKLKALTLSENPLLTIAIDHNWTPLFQLEFIDLDSCKLGPRFPTWLRSQQSIIAMSLYNTNIEDDLPDWFCNTFSITQFLDLSENKISGTLPISLESLTELNNLRLGSNLLQGPIPHLPPNLYLLDLSGNAFSGPLPPTLFTPQLNYLILSHNHINGSLPSNVCHCPALQHLNLSDNQIYGEIPQCWQEGSLLRYIHLGNNMLFGEIPSSLGNLMELEFLHLNNNSLKGHLPSSLQKCTQLLVVDLGDNKFSGNIPLWIGQKWHWLRILRLSSNMFDGNIDPQLGYLWNLQIIDFANNRLSGSIPHSFENFSTMISTSAEQLPSFEIAEMVISQEIKSYSESESINLVTKGGQLTFSSILYLVKSIDLSNNELTDEIPEELGYLVGLQTLNLSRNYFRGKIPDSIGRMSSLETLDFSFNNLSGIIPQSLSQLNALSHLNLSYNNLSGNIPSGNQLQTLVDASIYIGNPYLCGDLVNKSCFHENNTNATSEEHATLSPMLSIYLSSILGYLVGLWSVFVLLLFKKKWRYSYFKKVDDIYDKVYVTIKIRLNRIVNG